MLFLRRDYIVSGCQDGILSIWSLEDGECLCQKQVFGRIEVVKTRNDFLVTAHFGIAFDVGCITIRKIMSPTEMPVVFSMFYVSNIDSLNHIDYLTLLHGTKGIG